MPRNHMMLGETGCDVPIDFMCQLSHITKLLIIDIIAILLIYKSWFKQNLRVRHERQIAKAHGISTRASVNR